MLFKITEYHSGINLHAIHPEKRPVTNQEWLEICQEINERFRPIHDQWQKALNEAEADARKRHFTPEDPEWGVMLQEYFLDHGINLTTLEEMLITVLREKGYEVFENVTTHSLPQPASMMRELEYQRGWGKTHIAASAH